MLAIHMSLCCSNFSPNKSHAVLCCIMLCCVTLCCAMLCRAVVCLVVPCYIKMPTAESDSCNTLQVQPYSVST